MIVPRVIRIGELINFSSTKTIDGKLCITKQKAISIVNNPCADNNDVALITAWDIGECVAYLGVLPNHILENENIKKIYWMSSFYTAPSYQGKGIGTKLMEELKKENIDIYSSHRLTGTYIKAKFSSLGDIKYKAIDFKKLKSFFRIFLSNDFVRNKINKNLKRGSNQNNQFDFTPISQFGPEFMPFVKETSFLNSLEHYNWILKFPWVFSKELVGESSYVFSYRRDFFKHFAFEIRNNKKLIGGILFYISHNNNEKYMQISSVIGNVKLSEIQLFITKKVIEFNIDKIICQKELFKNKFLLNTTYENRFYVGFSLKDLNTSNLELTLMDGDRQLY
tara:strand:+ start:20079 stop:21086 length:1008 start_codon:yes stop_codon:yes gene_type:complete